MAIPHNDALLGQIAQATVAATGGSRQQHRYICSPQEERENEGRRIVLWVVVAAVSLAVGWITFM